MVKQIVKFTKSELTQLINDSKSCVKLCNTTYELALFPYHLDNIATSIKELLNVLIGKYNRKYQGILLATKNVQVLTDLAAIVADSCHIHIEIQADFYIFNPEIGSSLVGVVNKYSKNHVSCLVHRTFNVSITKEYDDDDWLGNYANIGDEIMLRIVRVNLNETLPFIQAKLLSIISSAENFNDSMDLSNNISKSTKTYFNDENEENATKETVTSKNKTKKAKSHKNNVSDSIENELVSKKKSSLSKKKKSNSFTQIDEPEVSNASEKNYEDYEEIHESHQKKNKHKRNSLKVNQLESSYEQHIQEVNERNKKSKSKKNDVSQNTDELSEEIHKSVKNKNKRKRTSSNIDDSEISHEQTNENPNKKSKSKRNSSINENELEIWNATENIHHKQEANESPKKTKSKRKDSFNSNEEPKVLDTFENIAHNSKESKKNPAKKSKHKISSKIEAIENSDVQDINDVEPKVSEHIVKYSPKMKENRKKSNNESKSFTEEISRIKLEVQTSKTIALISSPPMADSDDRRKKRKRISSLNVSNEPLKLQDSDLDKFLNESPDVTKENNNSIDSADSVKKLKSKKRNRSLENDVEIERIHKKKKSI